LQDDDKHSCMLTRLHARGYPAPFFCQPARVVLVLLLLLLLLLLEAPASTCTLASAANPMVRTDMTDHPGLLHYEMRRLPSLRGSQPLHARLRSKFPHLPDTYIVDRVQQMLGFETRSGGERSSSDRETRPPNPAARGARALRGAAQQSELTVQVGTRRPRYDETAGWNGGRTSQRARAACRAPGERSNKLSTHRTYNNQVIRMQ